MKKRHPILSKMKRVLLFAAAIILVTIGSGYSAESIDVPSITPLFEHPDESLNRRPGIAGTRNGFIERIGEDGKIVVISDATKRLAAEARFYRKAHGTAISLSEFQVGTYVGYTVNDKAEIVMMWIAE
jgi:hypothetical protein